MIHPNTADRQTPPPPRPVLSFGRRFWPLFGAGMLGVLALAPVLSRQLPEQIARLPEPPPLPSALLVSLALLQSAALLAGAVAVGAALAPRLGLRSHLAGTTGAAERPLLEALRREAPLAIGGGVLGFVAVALLDAWWFRSWLGEPQWRTLSATLSHRDPAVVLLGLLYGGVTEELFARWGTMSLLAWLGGRAARRRNGPPLVPVMWSAVAISALLFGAFHLPATAGIVPLTPAVVVRALALNGVVGMIAGWLFWRRSLESAMLAHAAFHAAAALVAMAGLAPR